MPPAQREHRCMLLRTGIMQPLSAPDMPKHKPTSQLWSIATTLS